MIVGYLDSNQRNISEDKQRDNIKQYAEIISCPIDVFISGFDIRNAKDNINSKKSTFIVANIACLGAKLNDVAENIELLLANGFELISVKENIKFDSSEESKQLLKGIKLSIEIRNSMVSVITRKALDEKKAQGYKLGRDFGSKNKKRVWDGKEEEIKSLLLAGVPRLRVAKEVGISIMSLYGYLKLNPDLEKATRGGKDA